MNQKQTLNSSQQICFDNDMSQQFRNYFQSLLSKYILCMYTSYNTFFIQSYAALCLVTQLCPTLCNSMGCSPLASSVHGDSPGKNTGVDYHALLQGIFSTHGWNPGLPHFRWVLSHQGSHIKLCIYIYNHIYIYIYIYITEGRYKYRKDCYETYGAGLEYEVLKY